MAHDLEELLRALEDPIRPVTTPSDVAGSATIAGFFFLTAGFLVALPIAVLFAADGELAAAASIVSLVGVPWLIWRRLSPDSLRRRALGSHLPRLYVESSGDIGSLRLSVAVDDQPTPFDPLDPAQLDAARLLRACRLRDGLGLAGHYPGRVSAIAPTEALSGPGQGMKAKLADWQAALVFLAARTDPRGAWLAAMLCTEATSPSRARAALDLLDQPEHGEARAAALAWLRDEGPLAARGVAAIASGDLAHIDRVIAAGRDAPDRVVATLMEARWALDPDPEAMARWIEDARLAPALAESGLFPRVPGMWLRMAKHRDLDVAIRALRDRALTDPELLPAARLFLDRADVAALCEGYGVTADRVAVIEQALDALGTAGDIEDLRRLAEWSRRPGPIGRFAAARRAGLEALIDSPELAGGLALSTHRGPAGALSEADDGRLTEADGG